MLVLAALILATPPTAPAVDVAAIAFRLADTAPHHRVELLKEFSTMWRSAPWGPKAVAAIDAGRAATQATPAQIGLGRRVGRITGLGLSICTPSAPLLVGTQLVWASSDVPLIVGARSTWPVGDAPDMDQLRAEVRREDRYAHAGNLVDLAHGHWRRGELDAARVHLANALAELQRVPDVEFDAFAWDDAQELCLQLGDFQAALSGLQYRAKGGLEALDTLVQFAFDFDQAEQVLAAVPVLFALSPGIEDDLPDPPTGCADAMHPLRRAKVQDWAERLLADGFVRLHASLLQAIPDAAMREALRGSAVESLLLDQHYDAAWAVFAQMGLQPHEVKLGVCADIEAPAELRPRARMEIIEGAADAQLPALALKGIASAFETGEVAQLPWDSAISVIEAHGDISALAAIVSGAQATQGRRDAQLEWVDMMLLSADEQSVYAASATMKALLTDAEQITEVDEAITSANEDLADEDHPMGGVGPPEERLPEALRLAKLLAARGDLAQAHKTVAEAWGILRALPEDEVAADHWLAWARLTLLLGDGALGLEQASGLPTKKARLKALQALGDAALNLRRAKVNVTVAQAIAGAVVAQPGPANAGTQSEHCPLPTEVVAGQTIEPWLADWAERGRFDVAVQMTRALPVRVGGRRLAHLILQMADENRFAEALLLAPDVSAIAPDCAADDESPRDVAWLGLIDKALSSGRFGVAARAVTAMPAAPVDIDRFAGLMRRLFDGLAEAKLMPDLSLVLGRFDTPPSVKAIVQRETVRQHLAQGRVGAALTLGRESDRRTRMLLLLALAGAPDKLLAEHTPAIRDLGR